MKIPTPIKTLGLVSLLGLAGCSNQSSLDEAAVRLAEQMRLNGKRTIEVERGIRCEIYSADMSSPIVSVKYLDFQPSGAGANDLLIVGAGIVKSKSFIHCTIVDYGLNGLHTRDELDSLVINGKKHSLDSKNAKEIYKTILRVCTSSLPTKQ